MEMDKKDFDLLAALGTFGVRRAAGVFEQYGFVLLLVVLAGVGAFTLLGNQISAFISRVARMFG